MKPFLVFSLIATIVGCGEAENRATATLKVQLTKSAATALNQVTAELTALEMQLEAINVSSGYADDGGFKDSRYIYKPDCGVNECWMDMMDPAQVNANILANAVPLTIWEGQGEPPEDATFSFTNIVFGIKGGDGLVGDEKSIRWQTTETDLREVAYSNAGPESISGTPIVVKEGQSILVTLDYSTDNLIGFDDGAENGVDCDHGGAGTKEEAVCFRWPKFTMTATVQ